MSTFYGFKSANREEQSAWFCTRGAAEEFNKACGGSLGEIETTNEPDGDDIMDAPGLPWSKSEDDKRTDRRHEGPML